MDKRLFTPRSANTWSTERQCSHRPAARAAEYAILETTGRKSGQPRRAPVGNGLDGNTFWLVAEHGRRAHYVRNIEANPRVRVKVLGTWRAGTAHALSHDDPQERLWKIDLRFNGAVVQIMGTKLLTARIDRSLSGSSPVYRAWLGTGCGGWSRWIGW
jgi:deazaflavin-dependent oxidoreductase (nitroreductase family)